MQIKISNILEFPSFFEKVKVQKIPFKTSYKLVTLAREIEKHYNFYLEEFNKLVNEYGETDENGNLVPINNGNGIKIVPEKLIECQIKLEELKNLEVDLPDVTFLPEEFESIELSPIEANAIMPFIKE
jgi:hypothetical protein